MSAAVLTGGVSRRMGTDKALLEFDGQPLLQRVLDALRAVADEVVIVGRRDAYQDFGAPVLSDEFPGCGTLGGIATALRAARHEHVLVVACDMPLLSIPLLRAMAAEPRDYDVLIPVLPAERSGQGGGETLETLHAIYTRRCLAPMTRRLAAGRLKVSALMNEVGVRRLDEVWLRRYDAELRSFVNANTVAELIEARRLAESATSGAESGG